MFVVAVAVFLLAICLSFYRVYTPWDSDCAWILHCDYRFANIAEWFRRGSTDYHINYYSRPELSYTPNLRPLTASFFYLASLGHRWTGYKSQLALNHLLFLLVFWTYLKFLRRFTPLPTAARWLVGACFLMSPVWSGAYFMPASRVHLLETASVLVATLVLPAPEETARRKRVVLAACISAGAIFAHEIGVVAPVVVALTHYWTSPTPDLRRKAAREAMLIVAVAYSLYFAVRLAFFHVPPGNAYPLMSLTPLRLAFHGVNMLLKLFFPSDTVFSDKSEVLGPAAPAIWLTAFITLVAYLFLAVKLLRQSRYSREIRMLATCALVASTSVVLEPIARTMSIVLIYSLPLLYLALEPFTLREMKQFRLAQAGAVLVAGALPLCLAVGLHSFLKMRAEAESEAGYARAMQPVLVSAMRGGANHIFLINDLAGLYSSRAMLQLTAKENGVTLIHPTVVNQLEVSKAEPAPPVQAPPGVLVECRDDVLSIRIELAAGRAFWFAIPDPQVPLKGADNGRYEFPYLRRTASQGRFLHGATEQVDLGSNLMYSAPTPCGQTAVVGFPGRGVLEPKVFFLGKPGTD